MISQYNTGITSIQQVFSVVSVYMFCQFEFDARKGILSEPHSVKMCTVMTKYGSTPYVGWPKYSKTSEQRTHWGQALCPL